MESNHNKIDNFATDFRVNLSNDGAMNETNDEKEIALFNNISQNNPKANISIDRPREEYKEEHIVQPPQHEKPKKNRTLQYMKFLLYSMKVEIKIHELIDVIRFSSQSEISLWILSMVLYFNGQVRNILVFFQVLHVIRGLIGMIIIFFFPKTHQIIDTMNIDEASLDNREFNDVIRDVAKKELIPKIQWARPWIVAYIIFTFLCLIIDLIDFLYVLSNLDEDYYGSSRTIARSYLVYFSMYMIAFLFLACDFSYLFWINSLRYTFPTQMLIPIKQAFDGYVENLKIRFKLNKRTVNNNLSRNINNV